VPPEPQVISGSGGGGGDVVVHGAGHDRSLVNCPQNKWVLNVILLDSNCIVGEKILSPTFFILRVYLAWLLRGFNTGFFAFLVKPCQTLSQKMALP
jgi:hypothetical protein